MSEVQLNDNQYSMGSVDNTNNKLVSDFLQIKQSEEKTYQVFCHVEYGTYFTNTDNDDDEVNNLHDTYSNEFECYVHARSKEDAMQKVEDIFDNDYDDWDFKDIWTSDVRPMKMKEIIVLTRRDDLQKKYDLLGDDYILCNS